MHAEADERSRDCAHRARARLERRKEMLWVVAATLCVAPTVLHAQTVMSPADTEVIAFLDRAVALAQRHDTVALRRLTDSGFVFVHSTGRVDDRTAFLTFAMQRSPDSVRVLGTPQVRHLGSVAYVLTHTATWVSARGWSAFRATDVVMRTPAGLRWIGHQSTALPPTPTFRPLDSVLAAALSGRYESGHGVVRHVAAARDRLLVRTGDGSPVAYGALSATTFHAERANVFLVFFRDSVGRVSHMELLQGASAERFERRGKP
jgi:hypothetical protein